MPYVIDGNNLIGHSPGLKVRDDRSKKELVRRLSAFHRGRGAQILVVFDGEAGELVPDGLTLGGVKITYSGRYSDADSKIKSIVSRSKNPKELIVVSSDNELYNFVRAHGARAMKSHEFNQKLNEVLSEKADETKPEITNLSEWYKYFGIDAKDDEP